VLNRSWGCAFGFAPAARVSPTRDDSVFPDFEILTGRLFFRLLIRRLGMSRRISEEISEKNLSEFFDCSPPGAAAFIAIFRRGI